MRSKLRAILYIGLTLSVVWATIIAWRNLQTLNGHIDYGMLKQAKLALLLPGDLRFSSYGGDANVALELAKIIRTSNKNVHIGEYCISACAEFVMPSARAIYVTRYTIIGYHINDFIVSSQLPAHRRLNYCGYERYIWLSSLYKQKDLDVNFYKEIDRRLQFKILDSDVSVENKNCNEVTMTARRSMWYPTSKQLRTLLKMKVRGEICNDNIVCWKERLEYDSPPRAKYIVGDNEYTSIAS